MKKDIKQKLYVMSNVFMLGIVLVTFFPWMEYRNQKYTIISFYKAVNEAGGMAAFSQGDVNVYPAFVVFIFALLAALVALIRLILQLLRGRKNWINNILYLLEEIYMVLLFSFYGWDPTMWNLVVGFFVLVDFLISKFLADYNLMTKQNEALRIAHKKEAQERKRRLYFPRKYSKQLHRLLLASVESNRNNQILLALVGAVTTSYTFAIFTLSRSLKAVHSSEMLFLGNGMEASLKNAMFVAFVLDAVVMSLVITRVLSGREKADSRMMKLGAREELIRMSWTIEMTRSCAISLGLGFVLGILEVEVLLHQASKQLGTKITISIGVFPIAITAGVMILIFIATTLWNHEKMIQRRYYNIQKRGADYVPSIRIAGILFVMATVVTGYSAYSLIQRRNFENIKLYGLMILGIAIIVVSIASVFVRQFARSERRLRTAYAQTLWTFNFRKTIEVVLITFAIGAVVTVPILQTAFLSQSSDEELESLFPYDIVAFGHDADENYFYQVGKNSNEMTEIPMVRVTAVEGEPFDWKDALTNAAMKVIWPQGQNIGISWSSYKKLCQIQNQSVKCEAPQKKEIVIVYQQDAAEKSHPIDYYLFRTKPFLRIGQPLRTYYSEERKYLYPQRTVKAEFNQNLIGMLNRGSQENLIVFSDEYFKTLKTEEGPSHMYLIQMNEKGYNKSIHLLNKVAKRNAADASFDREIQTYYEKRQLASDTESERYFQKTMLVYEILMMMICLLLILMIYSGFIRRDLIYKYQLLHKLGIREDDQRRALKRELNSIYILPLLVSGVATVSYAAEIIRIRAIEATKIMSILLKALPYWCMPVLVIVLFEVYMYRSVKKRTAERRENYE